MSCFAARTACRAGGEQLADDAIAGSVEVAADLVDETDVQRGGGVEPLAGEEIASRGALADPRAARTAR